MKSKLIRVLEGETISAPPVWLMRQAGRYLPEYRATRAKAKSFLDLCYSPALAEEVTLQPIRRFGFDAAILFSDILVVPDALGRKVEYVDGEGPRLEPIAVDEIAKLKPNGAVAHLAPVIETVSRVRNRLAGETALIGFCGAPWTVATYMIAGEATPDQMPARMFAYRHEQVFASLIDILTDVSIDYLSAQLQAGADAVMIFDSWAGILPPGQFEKWCLEPARRIVAGVREANADAKVIGFPRGAGGQYARFAQATQVNAVGLDWSVDGITGRAVQAHAAVQGNLDPLALLAGGDALDQAVDRVLADFGGGRLIFNLGHGILPKTPIENVERMLKRVRAHD